MTRTAYSIVNTLKSHINLETHNPKYVCDVTTLSRYQKEEDGPYCNFIEDNHKGCNLDMFKDDFAAAKNINKPSSCDALFIWEDVLDNADRKTKLKSKYSGESLLFVEFKHAPIFTSIGNRINFLHQGQNGGVDDGCYEASIQKKLEDSCIILMQMLEEDKEYRLRFEDCRRMNVAFIVYNSAGRNQNGVERIRNKMVSVRLNQKKVFRGLENYLYRKVLLMSDTVFKELLDTGRIYISKD